MKKKISVIIPCYNEEENIEIAYTEVKKVLETLTEKYKYEILFADNGSTDKSEPILRRIADADKNVKVIFNQTNFGPDPSITNLMIRASGDAVILICCDLQEPPEMIPDFVREWEAGNDVVWGTKNKSQENPIKYFCRKVYYKIIDELSDYRQFHQVYGFGLMSRSVVDTILVQKKQDPEMSVRHIVGRYGFKVVLLPYTQKKRERGKSSYNVYRYYEFALSSLCMTSLKPLRLMTIFGFITAFLCAMVSIFYLVYKLTHWMTFSAGQAPLVIGLFFVSGVMLLCIGILGEYIGILIRRITNTPIVIERELLNFEENEK